MNPVWDMKMESGDPTVSLDLVVRSLLARGASRMDIARVIAQGAHGRVGIPPGRGALEEFLLAPVARRVEK